MNVLIAGGAGFLGCNLIPQLLNKGYRIKCLDKLFFGEKAIESFKNDITLIKEDLRTFNPSILENIDICINLAAISQPDHSEILDSRLYYEINHQGCLRLAQLCKKKAIKRFIFTSTCSVYGFQDTLINERSNPNPLEAYGKSKLLAENELLNLADDKFIVTLLRPGTMYGISPKMRFDLVVNGMTWTLQEFNKVAVMRNGNQWRPNVHVKDVARLITKLLELDEGKIQKEIFNVGTNKQNYQILPLAKLIGDSVGINYELDWYGEPDTRSYRVDFSKLEKKLGFKIKHNVEEAAKNIYNALEEGKTRKDETTSVVRWYKKISNEGLVKLLNN